MKKFLFALMAAVACLTTTFTLASCNDDDDSSSASNIKLQVSFSDPNNELTSEQLAAYKQLASKYSVAVSDSNQVKTKVYSLLSDALDVAEKYPTTLNTNAYFTIHCTGGGYRTEDAVVYIKNLKSAVVVGTYTLDCSTTKGTLPAEYADYQSTYDSIYNNLQDSIAKMSATVQCTEAEAEADFDYVVSKNDEYLKEAVALIKDAGVQGFSITLQLLDSDKKLVGNRKKTWE